MAPRTTPRLPPFMSHEGSPFLARGKEGVAIRVGMLPGSGRWLFGTCRARVETARGLRDTLLHNVAVVCTWGPGFVSRAIPVVGTRVVFPDDIHEEPEERVAFFNLDLGSQGLPLKGQRFFILASFHTFLSEVVELDGR